MEDYKHGMIMCSHATDWQDALPSGNGRIGALVYGNPYKETIIFNHDALWYRGGSAPLPDVSRLLPELRSLLASEKWRDANELYTDRLKELGFGKQMPYYHPAFDLQVTTEDRESVELYSRYLDFESGQASVKWQAGGINHKRDLFVSRVDDVIVLSIQTNSPDGINLELAFRQHDPLPGTAVSELSFEPSAELSNGEGLLIMRADGSDGGQFGGCGRITAESGIFTVVDGGIRIDKAKEVLVVVKLYANETFAPGRLNACLEELPDSYQGLFIRHRPVHREIFLRADLDFHVENNASISNEKLLEDALVGGVSLELTERLFDYGRYLLISSSAPGSLPSNLQGIWNGSYSPPWHAFFTNNENVQMDYWQALPGNMPETLEPYFDYYDSILPDCRENARKLFGCRGIFLPLCTAPPTGILREPSPHVLSWTAGAGWIAQIYYDYWLFTGDRQFLRSRAVPYMKEAALFYEDFVQFDRTGKCLFSPSNSPENAPLILSGRDGADNTLVEGFPVSVNATMDIAVAKELLTNLCEACEILEIEADSIPTWRNLAERLPDYEINEDGALKEWLHPSFKDNYPHRHYSHLYPLFPGIELTGKSDPNLIEACRIALEKRLSDGIDVQMGWSLSHLACLYARLGDGNRAIRFLSILTQGYTGENLFTYINNWRTGSGDEKRGLFQMEANLGFSAAVLEMLCFSQPELVKLLPALPTQWRSGSIKGILCRGGMTVDISWDMESGRIDTRFLSGESRSISVCCPRDIAEIISSEETRHDAILKNPRSFLLQLSAGVPSQLSLILKSSPSQ